MEFLNNGATCNTSLPSTMTLNHIHHNIYTWRFESCCFLPQTFRKLLLSSSDVSKADAFFLRRFESWCFLPQTFESWCFLPQTFRKLMLSSSDVSKAVAFFLRRFESWCFLPQTFRKLMLSSSDVSKAVAFFLRRFESCCFLPQTFRKLPIASLDPLRKTAEAWETSCVYSMVYVFLRRWKFPFTYLTFRGPCIMIYSYNKSQRDALFLNFIW